MVQAVILAAGRGSRLGNLTSDRPKCLVELWGKPLLNWQMDALRGAGIEDITVIRGYMAEKITVPGVSYLENRRWAETNMVATLMEARSLLESGPTVVSYSDIVYSSDAVRALLDCVGDIRITYDPKWRHLWEMRFEDPLSDAETFKVDADTEKLVEIGSRPQTYEEVQGQYMGLLYFEPEGWRKVMNLIEGLEPSTFAKLDCTSLLKRLLPHEFIRAVPIRDEWCEVDSIDDIAAYGRTGLSQMQRKIF